MLMASNAMQSRVIAVDMKNENMLLVRPGEILEENPIVGSIPLCVPVGACNHVSGWLDDYAA